MVQNQLSIRYTKACWLVNKNFELIMITESLRVKIALEYFACRLMMATRFPSLSHRL